MKGKRPPHAHLPRPRRHRNSRLSFPLVYRDQVLLPARVISTPRLRGSLPRCRGPAWRRASATGQGPSTSWPACRGCRAARTEHASCSTRYVGVQSVREGMTSSAVARCLIQMICTFVLPTRLARGMCIAYTSHDIEPSSRAQPASLGSSWYLFAAYDPQTFAEDATLINTMRLV